VPEFVNPKYADADKIKFKSATRLECMMQDLPALMGPEHKVVSHRACLLPAARLPPPRRAPASSPPLRRLSTRRAHREMLCCADTMLRGALRGVGCRWRVAVTGRRAAAGGLHTTGALDLFFTRQKQPGRRRCQGRRGSASRARLPTPPRHVAHSPHAACGGRRGPRTPHMTHAAGGEGRRIFCIQPWMRAL